MDGILESRWPVLKLKIKQALEGPRGAFRKHSDQIVLRTNACLRDTDDGCALGTALAEHILDHIEEGTAPPETIARLCYKIEEACSPVFYYLAADGSMELLDYLLAYCEQAHERAQTSMSLFTRRMHRLDEFKDQLEKRLYRGLEDPKEEIGITTPDDGGILEDVSD